MHHYQHVASSLVVLEALGNAMGMGMNCYSLGMGMGTAAWEWVKNLLNLPADLYTVLYCRFLASKLLLLTFCLSVCLCVSQTRAL